MVWISLKKGWSRTCQLVILFDGSRINIFFIRSIRGSLADFSSLSKPRPAFCVNLNPSYLNFFAPLGQISWLGSPSTLNIL